MRKILLIAAMMTLGTSAFARGGAGGVLVGLNVGMSDDSETRSVGGVDTDYKNPWMLYDLDLGYAWTSGLYIGGVMDSAASGDTVKMSQSLMGVSVGYMAMNGFRIVGHYFLSGTASNKINDKDKFGEVTGMGVDIGYLTMLSSSFGLGFDLAYRSLTDKKYTDQNGTDVDTTSIKESYYSPRISLAFFF